MFLIPVVASSLIREFIIIMFVIIIGQWNKFQQLKTAFNMVINAVMNYTFISFAFAVNHTSVLPPLIRLNVYATSNIVVKV